MKYFFKAAFYAALIAVCFSGCVIINLEFDNFDAVTGEGDREIFTIDVGEFTKVRIDASVDLVYTEGFSDSIMLEVQPNLRKYFKVYVSDGELVVRMTKKLHRSSRLSLPKLTISANMLEHMTINSTKRFVTEASIKADSFTLKYSGGNYILDVDVNNLNIITINSSLSRVNLDITGRADTMDLKASGDGNFRALGLPLREARIDISSAWVFVNVSDYLSVSAEAISPVGGNGAVRYSGSPFLDLNIPPKGISVERVEQ